MNNEEKILEMLGQINTRMDSVDSRLERVELTQAQMQADISELKRDVAGLKDDVAGLKNDVAVLQDDVSGIKVRLDIDVERKLNLLAEGHGILVERLDALDDVKQLAEKTKATVDVICIAVQDHSVEINALKSQAG